MSEWQPIETAPRGTTLLLYNEREGVFVGKFVEGDGYDPDRWIACPGNYGGEYSKLSTSGYAAYDEMPWLRDGNDPTHWMPLLEPPENAKGQ